MNKDVKILIVPDVHARDFWREPVKETLKETDAHIIFLGDYLDPYDDEWKGTGINPREKAVETLQEIIALKKEHPDRITLLIGNHDAGYVFGRDWCSCRMDFVRRDMISTLFRDNYDLFKLAEIHVVNGKKFVFSHAGISHEYAKVTMLLKDEDALPEIESVVDYLNNGFLGHEENVIVPLSLYSNYRGYSGYWFGSVIWSDIREWVSKKPTSTSFDGVVNIMGHTQLGDKAINFENRIYDLDVRQCFYISSEGDVIYWDSNTALSETITDVEE